MKATVSDGLVSTRPTAISKRKVGLKPGQKHSGSFKPGHDPRRNLLGPRMSEKKRSFMEACREKTDNALDVLEEAMNDPHASWRDRMSAAALILDHGHGKPVDRQVVASMNGQYGGEDYEPLSDAELTKIIRREFP